MLRRARHRVSTSAPTRLLLGVLTGVGTWLVVLSHLAASLHFALISHEVCAAHGELVHASAAHERLPPAGRHSAVTGAAHAEHEHCPLVGRRHESLAFAPAPRAPVVAPPEATQLLRVPDTSSKPSRAALLLSAPKQSPPV